MSAAPHATVDPLRDLAAVPSRSVTGCEPIECCHPWLPSPTHEPDPPVRVVTSSNARTRMSLLSLDQAAIRNGIWDIGAWLCAVALLGMLYHHRPSPFGQVSLSRRCAARRVGN